MISVNQLFETAGHQIPPKLPIGKHNHIPDEDFDKDELEKGIRVEFEHSDNPEYAKAIAKDHLAGDCPNYYSRLERMEAECEK